MEENKRNNFYLWAVIGVLIILLLSLKHCQKEKVVIDTKTVIKVVERWDTIKIDNPKIVYKWKKKVIKITDTDTIFEKFNPKDYTYCFDTITQKTNVNISGWGDLSSINIISKCKDSVIEKTTTITNTIFKNESGLFLAVGYAISPSQNNSFKSVGLDYSLKNKLVFGVNAGIDNYVNPFVGARVSFKIK